MAKIGKNCLAFLLRLKIDLKIITEMGFLIFGVFQMKSLLDLKK